MVRPSLLAFVCNLKFVQTPGAVERLRALMKAPTPQHLRIGVRNKGCAGLSYHLEYVDKPGRFDEVVEQDGVKVLIDSKALFSIIGSEMDWQEDALRYVGPHSPYRRLVIRSTQRQVRFQEPQHQGRMRVWRVVHGWTLTDVVVVAPSRFSVFYGITNQRQCIHIAFGQE